MKYHPVLPQKNVNVSTSNPLREFASLLAGLALLLLIVYWLLGFFVDWAVDVIPLQTEQQIYQSIGVDDWGLTEASQTEKEENQPNLQPLLDSLAQCTDIGFAIKVSVQPSETVNAMAVPGGNIIVMSGLLAKIKSQNGLAFVLAHELAHFKNRDHLRNIGRGVVLIAVTSVLGISNTDISNLLAPVNNLNTAQFSQHRESEADVKALQILNCHYGHVGGATEFFEVLMAEPEGMFDFALLHYFSTHPEVKARIETLEALGKSKGYAVAEPINL